LLHHHLIDSFLWLHMHAGWMLDSFALQHLC